MGEPEQAAIDASGGTAPDDEAAAAPSVPTLVAEAAPVPGSMFRPTMHDGSSASETAGRTVPDRPLETQPDGPTAGTIAPSGDPASDDPARDGPDGAADHALILGPAAGEEAGGEGGEPASEAPGGTTAPALAADLIDGTNLFGDRAAMWSGDPSEVGAGYGVDPSHAEICLCDQTSLASGEAGSDLAS